MIENQFEGEIKEKTLIPLWVISLGSVLVAFSIVAGGYLYYVNHTEYPPQKITSFVLSDELKAKVDTLMKEDEYQKAQFASLDTVTIAEPGDTNESDAAVYFAAIKNASSTVDRSAVVTDTVDQLFTVGSTSFGNFLAAQTDRSRFDALFTHLHATIKRMADTYKRPILANRLAGVVLVGSAPDAFVYPSTHVADAYLGAAIVTALDASSATMNSEIADDFVKQGMMSGWYGQSDIDATKALVDEYLSKISLRDYLIRYAESPQSN